MWTSLTPNSFGADDEPIYLEEVRRAPQGHLPPTTGQSGPPVRITSRQTGYGAPFVQPLMQKRVLARTYQVAGMDKKGKPKQPKPYRWSLPRTNPQPPQGMYSNG